MKSKRDARIFCVKLKPGPNKRGSEKSRRRHAGVLMRDDGQQKSRIEGEQLKKGVAKLESRLRFEVIGHKSNHGSSCSLLMNGVSRPRICHDKSGLANNPWQPCPSFLYTKVSQLIAR